MALEPADTAISEPDAVDRHIATDPDQTDFEVPLEATARSLLFDVVPNHNNAVLDWCSQLEPPYRCGKQRILGPYTLPSCHPTQLPTTFGLARIPGFPSSDPLSEGPGKPRIGSCNYCRWPVLRRVYDAFVDYSYPQTIGQNEKIEEAFAARIRMEYIS